MQDALPQERRPGCRAPTGEGGRPKCQSGRGPKLTRGDVELVVSSALHRAWHADLIAAARLYKLDTKSGECAKTLGQCAKRLDDVGLNRFLAPLMLLQCPALAGSEAKARKIDLKAIEQAVDREQAARKAKAGSVPNSKRENTPARRPVTSHPAVRSKARKAG